MRAKKRNRFFRKLSQYKKVDSGGRHLNNLGYVVNDKNEFIKDYKFTIAFENSCYPGYTSEKLVQPMVQNSLPIYWGNKLVEREFNPKSFINLYDFEDEDAAIDWIIKVDKDDDLYMSYFQEPYFHDNTLPEFLRDENICRFFSNVFTSTPSPISLPRWSYANLKFHYSRFHRRLFRKLGMRTSRNQW